LDALGFTHAQPASTGPGLRSQQGTGCGALKVAATGVGLQKPLFPRRVLPQLETTRRKLKTWYFVLEGLNSFSTVFYCYYLWYLPW